MLSKSAKLRALIRDLVKTYDDPLATATPVSNSEHAPETRNPDCHNTLITYQTPFAEERLYVGPVAIIPTRFNSSQLASLRLQ